MSAAGLMCLRGWIPFYSWEKRRPREVNMPKGSRFGSGVRSSLSNSRFVEAATLAWLVLSPFLFFHFGLTCCMQKFPGQGSNLPLSNDNSKSLTY